MIKIFSILAVFALSGNAFSDGVTIMPANYDPDGGEMLPDRDCWTITENNRPSDTTVNALAHTTGTAQCTAGVGKEHDDPNSRYDDTETIESYLFADVYSTSFDFAPLDPSRRRMSWDGPVAIDRYVSGWKGTDAIHREYFRPGSGTIAYSRILSGDTNQAPEPGTLAFFGIGLFSLGLMGRRRND